MGTSPVRPFAGVIQRIVITSSTASRKDTMDKKRRNQAPFSSALLSSALQQEFMRDLNVDLSMNKRKKKKRVIRPVNAPTTQTQTQARRELTLAQHMGLVDAPRALLTSVEWDAVLQMSRSRKDSEAPCPICTECYKVGDQVLLSCSHVFHSQCLKSFERLSPKDPTCPLCRRKHYEKKLIDDGAVIYRASMALRIQCMYRGHKARQLYREMVLTIPPREAEKRHEFYMQKLERTTLALNDLMEQKEDDLDRMFAEFDQNIVKSRQAMQDVAAMEKMDSEEWDIIALKAELRGQEECPICMVDFCNANGVQYKPVCLLSCTHALHSACLNAFETFTINGADQPELADLRCPLCRSAYKKIDWKIPKKVNLDEAAP